jgi:hypothetical protein
VRPRSACVILLLLLLSCSRLPDLTPAALSDAEQKWNTHKPAFYRLVIEMSGDRVETGRFEIEVRGSQIVSVRRNGLVVSAKAGEDYTMEGLFRMLRQELSLAEKPAMLGAPAGYRIYTTAGFDETTGRLLGYRRIVGGTSNAIEIKMVEYRENE